MRRLLAACLGAWLIGPQAVLADTGPIVQKGAKVVAKSAGFQLKAGDETIDRECRLNVYQVGQVKGPWLLLRSSKLSGWAAATDVVPLDSAVGFFTQRQKENPRDAFAWILRAVVLHAQGQDQPAIRDCDQAIEVDPSHAAALLLRGEIWFAQKSYDRAIQDYSQAIALDRRNALAYFDRGIAWQMEHAFVRALEDFDQAIQIDGKFAAAYARRGRVFLFQNKYDRAIEDLTEALRLNPADEGAYLDRGIARHSRDQLDQALADLNQAIRLNPRVARAFFSRGNVWLAKKDYDRAINDYNEALRLDPWYDLALAYRALARMKGKHQYDAAIRDCTKAIALNPKNKQAYLNRGRVWEASGDWDRAIADYTEAIRIDPNYKSAFLDRSWIWRLKGELDRAISDYSEVIRLNPGFAPAYAYRGESWRVKLDLDRALSDFQEAMRLDPDFSLPAVLRTATLFAAGRAEAGCAARQYLDHFGWSAPGSIFVAELGFFAARRAHQDNEARAILNEAKDKADTSAWRYQIVRFLRREIDPAKENEGMLDAQFCIAFDLLLSGRKDEAEVRLRWVKANSPADLMDHTIAAAELDRMREQSGPAHPSQRGYSDKGR